MGWRGGLAIVMLLTACGDPPELHKDLPPPPEGWPEPYQIPGSSHPWITLEDGAVQVGSLGADGDRPAGEQVRTAIRNWAVLHPRAPRHDLLNVLDPGDDEAARAAMEPYLEAARSQGLQVVVAEPDSDYARARRAPPWMPTVERSIALRKRERALGEP